jgi:sortase A
MRPGARRTVRSIERALWAIAALALGVYALVHLERTAYQAYEDWTFSRRARQVREPAAILRPGALIGRIGIPRLGLDAMVVESAGDGELRRAVGHVEGTALPGFPGNVALAAHRDTFFRHLSELRANDVINVTTLEGTFHYTVASTQVIQPEQTQVLEATSRPALTLVTCYPFHYVGNAPQRFIVRAYQTVAQAPTPAARTLLSAQ